MVLLTKILLAIASSLRVEWLFESTENQLSQTTDCLNEPLAENLSKLSDCESVNEVYLKGFVFDKENVTQFSGTLSKLQDLTLCECDINDDLVNLLVLPSGLKSIRLERLNLSFNGIHSVIDKLSPPLGSPLLESLEIIDCLIKQFPQQKRTIIWSSQKLLLKFSSFCHLKNICIDNLNDNYDSYHLLLSLMTLPLERIKLSCIHLSTEQWNVLLNEWTGIDRTKIFSALKEFDLVIESIDENLYRLMQFLFSIPSLEIISLDIVESMGRISLPPLPPNIKQLSLIGISNIYESDGKTPFYNSKNLSQLTHFTAKGRFKIFPYDLFDYNQLEYLKILCDTSIAYSSKEYLPYSKLRYLSIQSKYLAPLLNNFESNFPVIESLDIIRADWRHLDSHLKKIISSKTLKCLQINYYSHKQQHLELEGEVKSSIEELRLTDVWWEYASDLLKSERFPYLEKIYIETDIMGCGPDLGKVFEKLSSFPLLTSITLKGSFNFSHKHWEFKFENLRFFCLGVFLIELDLDYLLSCMPNLIELRIEERFSGELRLRNPVNVRYLKLPFEFFRDNEDYINVIKNTPNLIQLTTKGMILSPVLNIPFAPELAYYFKVLKEHFQNELQFEIHPNCLPIKLLKSDAKLLKLVRLKSPELPSYLNCIFPINNSKSSVEHLFTLCATFKDYNGTSSDLFVIANNTKDMKKRDNLFK